LRSMALVPALDAAGTVGGVVAGALKHVERVVVVDDGSTDGTGAVAAKAGAVVLTHTTNLGKGDALVTGFGYASANGYDAVVTLDADGQHDPGEMPKLLEKLETGADIVVGARLGDKDIIPKARYYTNLVGVTCISWRAGCRIEDTQSGFRAYRLSSLSGIKLTTHGFDTETEILIKAGRKGGNILSVPVRAIYTEAAMTRSHFRPVRDTYRICMVFLASLFWPKG
jgi:glycosyltransferase involved in cell wall biosynthesis